MLLGWLLGMCFGRFCVVAKTFWLLGCDYCTVFNRVKSVLTHLLKSCFDKIGGNHIPENNHEMCV